jgi:hypothetical protein
MNADYNRKLGEAIGGCLSCVILVIMLIVFLVMNWSRL